MAANTKVFVGSLPQGVKPVELRRLFESYGVVTECDVMNRCGFVHMETVEMAQNAIKALNSTPFKGQTIVVEKGRMKENKDANKGKQQNGGGDGNTNGNRRRRSRGNRAGRGTRGMRGDGMGNGGNQMMNSGEYDDSALQLCSALFYEMNRMLSQGVNMDMSNQQMMHQGNNIGGGGPDRNRSRGRARRNRSRKPEHLVEDAGNAKKQSAKPAAADKKPEQAEKNKQGKQQPKTNDFNSRENLKRNIQDNGGPIRKQPKMTAAPFNRNIGMAQNNIRNVNQNNGRGQMRSGGFINNGNFGNDFDDNFNRNSMGQGGMNNYLDRFNSYEDNLFANKLSGSQGMSDRGGQFGNNSLGGNASTFGNNFGMGNQDRRGFALPERHSFSGLQMGGRQSPLGASGNFASQPGRILDNYVGDSSFGLSRGSNLGNNSDFDIERRSANLGMMSRGNNFGNIPGESMDFERRSGNLDMLRSNTIGNIGASSFDFERRTASVGPARISNLANNMGGSIDFERRGGNFNLPKGNIVGNIAAINNLDFERRNLNLDNYNSSSLNRILNAQPSFNRGGVSNSSGFNNNVGSFGGNFGNNRANSNNFQNDFPPLGGGIGGGMNRNAARQIMMSDRRY